MDVIATVSARAPQLVAALCERMRVPRLHDRWITAAFQPDVYAGIHPFPRGTAKTEIAGQLAVLALRPGSPAWCGLRHGAVLQVLGTAPAVRQA